MTNDVGRPIAAESSTATSPVPGSSTSLKLVVSICHYLDVEGLVACLDSLVDSPPRCHHEIHVADNSGETRLMDLLWQRYGTLVKLHRIGYNSGYAVANNTVMRSVLAEYYLVLNPDTLVPAHAVDTLIRVMDEHPDLGILGPALVNPDASFQRNFLRSPSLRYYLAEALWLDRLVPSFRHEVYQGAGVSWRPFQSDELRLVDWISGACMLLRRDAVATVGFFDDTIGFLAEDQYLCYRLRGRGWGIGSTLRALVLHKGQASQSRVQLDWSLKSAGSQRDYFRRVGGLRAEFAYRAITAVRCLLRILVSPVTPASNVVRRRELRILMVVALGRHGPSQMPERSLTP